MRIQISFFLIFLSFQLFATHNRAGEITYEQVGDLTIIATITTYTKASSIPADRDSLEICWGDGTCEWVIRTNGPINSNGIPDGEILPLDNKINMYSISHTYSAQGDYKLHMSDPNRNGWIANVNPPSSDNVPFHIETEFTLLELFNSSPVLLEAPRGFGFVGQQLYHTPNAYDADGDSIAYRMVTPLEDVGEPVPNYLPLTDFGGELSFDETTGLMIWDSPTIVGQYVVAIEIRSYRNGNQIGSMIRDMLIEISDWENELPSCAMTQFDPNEFREVLVGDTIQFLVVAEDTENLNGLDLTVTSGLFDPSFSQAPVFTIFFESDVATEANFFWEVTSEQMRDQPYQVVFKAADDLGLAHYVVLRFKVVDELTNTSTINVDHSITLFPNPCQDFLYLKSDNFDNQSYEIWDLLGRKIRSSRIVGNSEIDIVGMEDGVYVVVFEDGRAGRFVVGH